MQKKEKNVSSNEIIKSGNYKVEVLGTYKDITSEELKKKAGVIQAKLGEKCVNVLRAGRTQKDANVRKELYQQNKMEAKKYYQKNKESILRNLALKNMRIRGSPPTQRSIIKYKITRNDMMNCYR